jgi:hypothetical protein
MRARQVRHEPAAGICLELDDVDLGGSPRAEREGARRPAARRVEVDATDVLDAVRTDLAALLQLRGDPVDDCAVEARHQHSSAGAASSDAVTFPGVAPPTSTVLSTCGALEVISAPCSSGADCP